MLGAHGLPTQTPEEKQASKKRKGILYLVTRSGYKLETNSGDIEPTLRMFLESRLHIAPLALTQQFAAYLPAGDVVEKQVVINYLGETVLDVRVGPYSVLSGNHIDGYIVRANATYEKKLIPIETLRMLILQGTVTNGSIKTNGAVQVTKDFYTPLKAK